MASINPNDREKVFQQINALLHGHPHASIEFQQSPLDMEQENDTNGSSTPIPSTFKLQLRQDRHSTIIATIQTV